MTTRRGEVAAGVALALLGAVLALLVSVRPAEFRVPAPVVYFLALALVLAGWTAVARARGHELLKTWLPVPLLACMVAPAVWIAFGPGRRSCAVGAMSGLLKLFGLQADLPCRFGFGVAAVVGIALVVLAAWQAVRSTRALRDATRR